MRNSFTVISGLINLFGVWILLLFIPYKKLYQWDAIISENWAFLLNFR